MSTSNFEKQLGILESRVDELTKKCTRLVEENASLRVSQENLRNEKAVILQKNNQAKSRVEAMIRRLKSMEQS
ncbi:MAG: TIGR02449 family protein [Gammaproteobacteria bacterium]|nr:MAG: TIGR02449 family protein [Gammaproteobacteria bacterium]